MMKRLHADKPTGGREKGFHRVQLPLCENAVVARKADLRPIMGLIEAGAAEGKLAPRTMGEVRADISLGGAFIYRLDEPAGGLGGVTFLSVYSQELAELRSVYVIPEIRHNGTGLYLARAALNLAKSLQIREVLAITKKGNEDWFAQLGFGERKDFRNALFRKTGATQAARGRNVATAVFQDLEQVMTLMAEGREKGMLVARGIDRVMADMRNKNAFVYRKHPDEGISGMAFLSRDPNGSKRLAEIRNLYARTAEAEIELVQSAVARGDSTGVNELMAIVKRDTHHAFTKNGFSMEPNNFRIAMFKELHRETEKGPETPRSVYV